MKVIVRLRRGVTSFRAELDNRDITNRFRPRSGGTARIASLSGVRPGEHRLTTRTANRRQRFDWDSIRFVVARPSEDFLSLLEHPTGGRQRRLKLGLTRKSATVRAWLNGKPVHRSLGRRGSGRSGTLDADHGLRHGRNDLKVLAFHKRGVADVDHRSFIVRGTRPIAGAGRRHRAQEGDLIRLNGGASRAANRGADLAYRWKVVKAPRGSKARLRGAGSPRPTLKLDKRGSYKLRLEVSEARAGAVASGWGGGFGARAAGLSSAGAVSADPSQRAVDTVTATALPPVPPVGTRIEVSPGGGRVGVSLPDLGTNGEYYYTAQEDARPLRVVALDRTDLVSPLKPLHNESYDDTVAGTAELLQDVRALGNDALVIITGECCTPGNVGNINAAIAGIGGEPVGTDGEYLSVIGIPDAPGSAYQNASLSVPNPDRPDFPPSPGELYGYLQLDNQDKFDYVPREYVPFNTAADGASADQAVISVGDKTYYSESIQGQEGYFVLVLDAGSLAERDKGTFPTDVGDVRGDANGLERVHDLLEKYVNDRSALVFVQSIGTPARPDINPAADWYTAVAAQQQELGGDDWLFLAIHPDDTSGYALVGPGDKPPGLGCCPWPDTKVASEAATGTAGRVKGVLGRNRRGQFHPVSAGAGLTADNSFQQVAYQPAGFWPMRDADHQPAIGCIADSLGLSVPIEHNYLDQDYEGNWGGWAATVSGYSYGGDNLPNKPSCVRSKFSETAFNEVKGQLVAEFQKVPQVYALISHAKSALGPDENAAAAVIREAADQVTQDVSSDAQTGGDASAIFEGVLDIGWILPDVGAVFGLVESVYSIAEGFMNTPAGTPALNVQAAGDELGDEVASQYGELVTQIDKVGGLLLSDWGKLQTTSENVRPGGPWEYDLSNPTNTAATFALSARGWAYQQLFPLVYAAFEPQDPFSQTDSNPGCPYRDAQTGYAYATHPFQNEPYGGFPIVTAAGAGGDPQRVVWLLARRDTTFLKGSTFGFDPPSGVPSQGLTDKMFKNGDPNIGRPPLPSEIRFLIDAYGAEGAHALSSPGGGCTVDGRAPGYQIPPPR